jgi:2-haloacid dehalogenase
VLTTAVFDLGGVVADWDPRYLYRSLFDDPADMEHFLATVCTPAWNHAMDAGRPRAEAIAELVERHPGEAERIHAWSDRWQEMLGDPIPGTAEILSELSDHGIRLLALTNWSAETFGSARQHFPAFGSFEAIVVSGEHGVAKPAPDLYRILLETHSVEPSKAVYIDDVAANVATAVSLGFAGIRFVGADALRSELIRLGMLGRGP